MLTLDTSGLLAALDGRDSHHADAIGRLEADSGPFVVPVGIMAEVAYMVERRLGSRVVDALLDDLEEGAFTLDYGEADLPRIRELTARYRDLPLGYADACVIACAERRSGNVLTYDFRHFVPVAREGTIRVVAFEDC